MDLGLRNRVCAVTGASRGIGRATATALGVERATVVLVGRDAGTLEDAAIACREAGGEADVLELDVTVADAGQRLLSFCESRHERLDVLVNNAGTSTLTTVEELTDEDWQQQWELHVMAPMRLIRAAAPAMARRGWGRIVNVCSSAGKRPSSTNMAYSVTKAAQLSLSRAFADRYAGESVLVNAVAPGPVGSELWVAPGGMADQAARAEGTTRERVLEAKAAAVPLGRMGTEDEIASVIAFLCSERASYVEGAAWSVDGGTVAVII